MKYEKGNVSIDRKNGKIEIVCKHCKRSIMSKPLKELGNIRQGLLASCSHYNVFIVLKWNKVLPAYYEEARKSEAIYITNGLVFIAVPRKQ